MLNILREAKLCPEGGLTSLAELGFAGDTPDAEWIADLGGRGGHIAITRDSNILNVALQRRSWRDARLGIIILDKKWGGLKIRDWARHVFYSWPLMTKRALDGPPGAAWTVKPLITEPLEKWVRQVVGPDDIPSGYPASSTAILPFR